jgi:hypothetical protein
MKVVRNTTVFLDPVYSIIPKLYKAVYCEFLFFIVTTKLNDTVNTDKEQTNILQMNI